MSELKGNAVVGQSGGCTPVINCSLLGVLEAAMKDPNIDKVYGSVNGIVGLIQSDLKDLTKRDPEELKKLYHTPSSALGSCRHKIDDAEAEVVVRVLEAYDIRYFFLIGGNDSADTSLKIANKAKELNYEIRVIAIPKTIDNDLPETDHCPGYGSVARFIAQTTQEAGLDTKAMKLVDPFKIIEVMGRNSGWMVAAAALGQQNEEDPPHIMCFPERPFDKVKFLKSVESVYKRLGYAIIVISETIRDIDGNRIGEKSWGVKEDSFGHPLVEDTAQVLCRLLEGHFKKRARFDKPGTIQRMSMGYISKVDQEEAYQLGKIAVELASQGNSAEMVIMKRKSGSYKIEYTSVALDKIANKEKHLPDEFINDKGTFVTKKFYDYALPLIGEPIPEFFNL